MNSHFRLLFHPDIATVFLFKVLVRLDNLARVACTNASVKAECKYSMSLLGLFLQRIAFIAFYPRVTNKRRSCYRNLAWSYRSSVHHFKVEESR